MGGEGRFTCFRTYFLGHTGLDKGKHTFYPECTINTHLIACISKYMIKLICVEVTRYVELGILTIARKKGIMLMLIITTTCNLTSIL